MLNKQSGMSLIQVMIALGLMSVIGLGVAELMVTSAKISKRSDAKLAQLVLMNEVQSIISSPTTCSEMVSATTQTYDQAAAQSTGWDIKFQVTPTEVLETGSTFNNDIVIRRLFLKEEGIDTTTPTAVTYRGRLFMDFEGTSDNMIGGALRQREIGLIYYTINTGSNELVNCNKVVETTPNDICMQMGGTYNYSTSSCSRFNYSGCDDLVHGQSYTENYSSGGNNCFRTFTCIDGQRIKTTDFCETATVDVPPSGPSGSDCVPPDTRTISAACPQSWYYGGRQNQQCIDGYWVDSGSVYGCTFSCFTAETQIMLPDGKTQVAISKIKVGDLVLGQHGAINEVVEIERVPLGNRLLHSFNDDNYFITSEHPVKTINPYTGLEEWKSFNPTATFLEHNKFIVDGDLRIGDELIKVQNQSEVLEHSKAIQIKNQSGTVYNLKLEAATHSPIPADDDRSHTYYANGYLVHNK